MSASRHSWRRLKPGKHECVNCGRVKVVLGWGDKRTHYHFPDSVWEGLAGPCIAVTPFEKDIRAYIAEAMRDI